ncbi:MAG: UDP-N-acetylglucosamine 2-epimerase [Candidatus Wallbacteria bacterium]
MKKICFFTGTRAEYGLLMPLLEKIKKEKSFVLQLIVSGSHLSHEFGFTYKEIENDGFIINKKIEILLSSDTPIGVSKAMGLGFISYAEAINELKPDLMVILGDRYESFAAASVCLILNVPVVHLYGGELTEGAFDDSLRHAITKIAHLHFTSTEEYRNRVIQLGENPEFVFNVGAIGLDNIKRMKLLSKIEFEKSIGFKLKKKNIIVTFHPVTLEKQNSEKQFKNLLDAIDELDDTGIIFTKPNADNGGREIISMIDKYVSKNSDRAVCFASLGQLRYLSALKYVDAVVGNSSSGIIEAPSFKIGTINIGDRQKGRIKTDSIIECDYDLKSIKVALKKLYSESFQNLLKKINSPYGEGDSAKKIIKVLKKVDLSLIYPKKFYDIKR